MRGPVRSVVEPDLIEELKGRLASLDLTALRDKAAGRYWQRVAFEDLPVAGRTRERRIDPTVVANADVRDVQGNLIVAAGTRTNPLDLLPFTQRLVVFDGADPRQVATAQRLGQQARPGQRVTYIVTGIDRRAGWEGLQSVENRLDAPVYLLHPRCARALRPGAGPGAGRGQGPDVHRHRDPPAGGPMTRPIGPCLAVVLLTLLAVGAPRAEDAGCPDAQLFSGKLITDICWACLFPVRLFGLGIGAGSRPAGASNRVVCACNDNLGVPHPGLAVGHVGAGAHRRADPSAELLPGARRNSPAARGASASWAPGRRR